MILIALSSPEQLKQSKLLIALNYNSAQKGKIFIFIYIFIPSKHLHLNNFSDIIFSSF